MKTNHKILILHTWLVSLMLLATACVNDDFNSLPKPPTGDYVSFRTETLDDFSSRSAGNTTTGTYAIRSMGIFASYTSDVWDGSTAPDNFFSNIHVSRDNDESPWTYSDEQLWPGSGKLTFFAYAPHSENAVYGSNKPSITTSTGTPTLNYSIAPTHDKQVDLLVATPVKNQTKHDYVTIPLRHALTKIAFSARVSNPVTPDVDIRITEISLSKLNSSGSISMDGSNRQWTGLSTPTTYTQSNTPGGGLKSLPLTDTYQSITPADGHLFVMPQTILYNSTDSVGVTVKYTTTVNGVPDSGKEYTLALGRAITKFDPGIAYNLMITIDNGVSFIVVPTEWDNTNVQVDIKNRILNITRIEANLYPGVATRIFFWSNQPKDSVYVRKEGNLDNGKYPTGTKYNVNDVFQNLSEKSATNLSYSGFTGTTESGEGYIDVLIKDNATSPYSPLLNDGDKRHIWLNASGLTRNILLNAVVKGNTTIQLYVGTFHRWNETGERIITWGYNGNWTAEVMEGAGEILIDNNPSPFMASGQLYSNGDVGDPEVAQLATTSTSMVNGTGRVYFRVGWKSRLANRGTAPRYGQIRVSGSNIGGTGKDYVFLYIRQGEADDYLMINRIDNLSSTVQWSPYNLTVEGLSAGGNVQVTANRANARFVQYPTQAGGIYKWVNSNQTVHPSAYAPVGDIAGWSINYYNGFWYPVMSMQESCPPGYRRPNRGSISASVESNVIVDAEVIHSLFEDISYSAGTNKPSNSVWGYYADGFFDRRKIENANGVIDGGVASAVDASSATVGYIGRLFYNPTNLPSRSTISAPPVNSLFFPAAGYRSDMKQHKDGVEGHYWSSTGATNRGTTEGWNLVVGAGINANTNTADLFHGMSVRCVRDVGFSTDLPPFDETGVPTALAFDADARKPIAVPVDALFVAKWNNTMARDFRLYTELDNDGNNVIRKITAKVTFRGTTSSGNHTVDPDVFATALGKVGSSVTYAFNHSELTWAAGSSFSFNVPYGWTATRYLGTSTTIDTNGKIVGVKDNTLTIVLNNKGRIVFTRTSAETVTP